MKEIFLDANVFFAGASSPRGGSGFILELAKKHKFEIITISQALLEAEQNIRGKLNVECLSRHYQNLLEIKPRIQPVEFVTLKEAAKFKELVPAKDIPILLGAILSNAKVFITLDRKHFLENKKLKKIKLPLEVMNPGDFLRKRFR